MAKLFSYILTPLYWLFFGLVLLVFHPIQYISLKIGGYAAHKRSVELMNIGLLGCIRILGGKYSFIKHAEIPQNVPIIFASNHQSMMDISPFVWWCRAHHPKFVSKMELGKGIPSVSFNLRHGGSVLIDRKDAKQSLRVLMDFGRYLARNNYSAVIYPEGTRSKTGQPKKWSENGLKMLIKTCPNAFIVPVTINNSWKLFRHGMYPIDMGIGVTIETHTPIQVQSMPFNDLIKQVEQTVNNSIKQEN